MKTAIIIFFSLSILQMTYAQNVGIGTNNPSAKLEVNQSLRSDIKIKFTNL